MTRLAPRPHPSVVFRMLADSAVLFSTESEAYFGLNEVAARIWELLPPTCETLDEIIERLAAVYTEVDRDRIRTDTLALLGELQEAGLVIARDGAASSQGSERAD